MGRPAPKQRPDKAYAHVGNYAAPVDTAGLDPEMKATMGFGPNPVKRPATLQWESLVKKVGSMFRGRR